MKTTSNNPIDLRDRSLKFSRDVIKFTRILERSTLSQNIISQLLRSSTSIGANFVEAKNSGSKKDFRNKVLISKKEAAETEYWLYLLEDFADVLELKRLQTECHEIILILQSITNALKN